MFVFVQLDVFTNVTGRNIHILCMHVLSDILDAVFCLPQNVKLQVGKSVP